MPAEEVLAEITPGVRVGLVTLTQWLLWALQSISHMCHTCNLDFSFHFMEASWIFVLAVRKAAGPTFLLVLNPLMHKDEDIINWKIDFY